MITGFFVALAHVRGTSFARPANRPDGPKGPTKPQELKHTQAIKVIVFPLGIKPGDLLALRVLTSRQGR